MTRHHRRRAPPEQFSRMEGKDRVITRGKLEYRLYSDAARRVHVECLTCHASTRAEGGLEAFMVEHDQKHTPAVVPPAVDDDIELLLADVRQLAGDERAVVRLVVDGLKVGRPQHGQLDVATDKRDLDLESIHEGRDQMVYDAADLLRRIRRRGGR